MSEFIFFASFAFIFGLVLGSFLNVLISRLPRSISIAFPPSNCPQCGHKIRFYHNIPVLSFVALRGRCYDCKAKISFQYPLIELLTGLMFLAVFLKFGLSLYALKIAVFVYLIMAAGLTDVYTSLDPDFECGIIPDTYTIGGTIIGIIFCFFTFPGIKASLIGAAVGFLSLWVPAWLYMKIRKQEGMGGGDIKLMMMIGAFLGYISVYFVVFGSALIGCIIGIPLVLIKKDRNYMIPYGVFIGIAAILYVFFEKEIISILFRYI